MHNRWPFLKRLAMRAAHLKIGHHKKYQQKRKQKLRGDVWIYTMTTAKN